MIAADDSKSTNFTELVSQNLDIYNPAVSDHDIEKKSIKTIIVKEDELLYWVDLYYYIYDGYSGCAWDSVCVSVHTNVMMKLIILLEYFRSFFYFHFYNFDLSMKIMVKRVIWYIPVNKNTTFSSEILFSFVRFCSHLVVEI